MSPQVVGLLLVTFLALVKTTHAQAHVHNNFVGQGGMLDHECYERPYQTTCVGPIPRYFFNATTQSCEQINNVCGYGGFFSLQQCDNKCTCRLPPASGTNTCPGAVETQRFFFQQNGDLCLPFTYYGCDGNGNNFASTFTCTMQCNAPAEIEQGDVMRRMGYTSEHVFEAQAGLFNYGGPPPPPPPPPSPKAKPALPPQHIPMPHPPSPPLPPQHPPVPPTVGHFAPPAPWNNPHSPPHRPQWHPSPPRPSYTPHIRSPRPPPNGQPPFGSHPMARQMIQPPPPHGMSNRRNPITHSTGKSTFSMNNVQDKLKAFAKNAINRQAPRKNGGGMNWNRPKQGQMNQMRRNINSQVTIQPTPVVSMSPLTKRKNWRGRMNQGNKGKQRAQGKVETNKIAVKPTSDQGITSGSLNQPKVNLKKITTTQSSVGFNGGTTDYYYYDNQMGTTAGYYNSVQSGWGTMRRGMGK
ncbi:ESX-1 secretion-associated protein EspI-like [Ylistrum balloti]|uniref:ESX-1 secretion-associated protein EspI-like n=1 Tax=Ylistrum balloti TaxID=509963 RepID=UPI002905F2E0|nr:ESX-1 secretion-associated protein EspI-like [Ylistrum balloti]